MKLMLILLGFFLLFLIYTPYAFANNLFNNPTFTTNLSGWDIGETPLEASGLQTWLRADSITNVNDGNGVGNWSDLSTNIFNAAQSTSSFQPIYKSAILNNRPVVRFNSTTYMQLPPSSLGLSNNVSGISIFTVSDSTSTTAQRIVSIRTPGNTDRATLGRTVGGVSIALGRALDTDAVQIVTGGSYFTNTFYVNDAFFDYANSLLSLYNNGTLATSSSAFKSSKSSSATNSKNIYIGTDGTTGFSGDLAEAIIFNQALGSSDRQNIEAYLANRYGLSLTSSVITAARDTTITTNNNPSAKITTSATSNFTQTITTGDTNTYNLSVYAYTNGNPVTASDLSLFPSGALQNPTYSSVGQGWYLLNAQVTGSTTPADYGVQVQANKTVYLSFMSLSLANQPSTDTGENQQDPNFPPGWKLSIMAGPNFSGGENFIPGDPITGISAYIANNAPHDDIHLTFAKSDPQSFYNVGGKILPPPQLQGFHAVSDLYGITAQSAFNGYPETNIDEPYTLLLSYYPNRIPSGFNTSDLEMIELNPHTNQWEDLDTPEVADPIHNTLANTTSDFGYFAIAISDYFSQNNLGVKAKTATQSAMQLANPPLTSTKPPIQQKKPEQPPTILPSNNRISRKHYCYLFWCF